jgi:hypothetical protein
MFHRFAFLGLVAAAAAGSAQPPQLSPAQRAHVVALGQALAQCHGHFVQRLAVSAMNVAQVTDRVLAACAAREAPIRAEVVRIYGSQNAPRVVAAQHAHYRQGISQMITQVRAHH